MIVEGELRRVDHISGYRSSYPKFRYENGDLMNEYYEFIGDLQRRGEETIMLVGGRTTSVGQGTNLFGIPFFQVITSFGVFYTQEANLLSSTVTL